MNSSTIQGLMINTDLNGSTYISRWLIQVATIVEIRNPTSIFIRPLKNTLRYI